MPEIINPNNLLQTITDYPEIIICNLKIARFLCWSLHTRHSRHLGTARTTGPEGGCRRGGLMDLDHQHQIRALRILHEGGEVNGGLQIQRGTFVEAIGVDAEALLVEELLSAVLLDLAGAPRG